MSAQQSDCVVCGKRFDKLRRNQVTCSTECSRNRYTRMPDVTIECLQCRKPFIGHPSRKFCCVPCREWFYEECYDNAPVQSSAGLYVYMWFDEGASLPYYVGHGGGSRVTDPHTGVRPPARYEIIRNNLTGEGALLLEATIIDLLMMLEAPLVNVKNPLARTERPPLTI